MADDPEQWLVFVDGSGTYYKLPRSLVERARVPESELAATAPPVRAAGGSAHGDPPALAGLHARAGRCGRHPRPGRGLRRRPAPLDPALPGGAGGAPAAGDARPRRRLWLRHPVD